MKPKNVDIHRDDLGVVHKVRHAVERGIDVKNVDPKNKKRRKRVFLKEIKNVIKTLNKKRCWQINKANQTKLKFPGTVLICMTKFNGHGSSLEKFYSCHVKSIT